ncbi:hypothetical protein QE152_g6118 [Popillia japonica]|uniref:Uncharacterized protein n=1 Tax=Popillia japonica TaxID=7064 RepID=A0AAW1MLH7_POPJA
MVTKNYTCEHVQVNLADHLAQVMTISNITHNKDLSRTDNYRKITSVNSTPADWSVSFFRQFRTTIRSPRTATVTRSTCPPTVVFRSYPVRLPTATQRDEQPQGRENLQPFSPIPLTLTTARAPEFSGIQERNWKRDGGARRGDRDSCIRVGRCSESTGYSWKNGDGGGVRSGDEYRCCDTGVVTNECMG